jgi:hypothetical protein
MAEISGPFDSGTFTEDGWDGLGRSFSFDGCIMAAAVTELQLTVLSGLNGTLSAGRANVRGGFLYYNDAAKTMDFTKGGTTPPNGSNPRIDLVVLRLDRAANSITAQIKTGTPAASPVIPTLQQDATLWEIPIASVLIPTSAVVLSTITDQRQWAYVPPGLCWVKLKKHTTVQNFTGGGASANLTYSVDTAALFGGGNAALFDAATNEFKILWNGLWDIEYHTEHTWITGQTAFFNAVSLNAAEFHRDQCNPQGASTSRNGVTSTIVDYPFKTGDRLSCVFSSVGGLAAAVRAESYATLRFKGPAIGL